MPTALGTFSSEVEALYPGCRLVFIRSHSKIATHALPVPLWVYWASPLLVMLLVSIGISFTLHWLRFHTT